MQTKASVTFVIMLNNNVAHHSIVKEKDLVKAPRLELLDYGFEP